MATTSTYQHPPSTPTEGDNFQAVGLAEYLENDLRPTFVLDLSSRSKGIAFANLAFRACGEVSTNIQHVFGGSQLTHEQSEFLKWATQTPSPNAPEGNVADEKISYTFDGLHWTATTLRSKWKIFSGCYADTQCLTQQHRHRTRKTAKQKANHTVPAAHAETLQPLHTSNDWTQPLPPNRMSDHVKFMRNFDWATTSLGPMSEWSNALRRSCNFLVADPRPASIMWGDDLTFLWNEGYTLVAGSKHPEFFGRPYREVWPELPEVEAVLKNIKITRQAASVEDSRFFLARNNGFLEETFFSFSLIPVLAGDEVIGIYNPAFEVTRRHIAERRLAMLLKLTELTAGEKSLTSFWHQVIRGLMHDEHDVPFATIYSVGVSEDASDTASHSSDTSSHSSSFIKHCNLEGTFGLPEDHYATTKHLDLSNGTDGLIPFFREASRKGSDIYSETSDEKSFGYFFKDVICRPFKDKCRAALIFPVKPTGGAENVRAFVVLGLNPRRPYDDDYQLFVQLLSRLLSTSVAATMLIEEEIKKGRNLVEQSALDHQMFREELAISAFQVKKSEMKFTHFADNAPIAMCILDAVGNIIYANKIWYNLTQYSREDTTPMAWMGHFHITGDVGAPDIWKRLLEKKVSVTFEAQLKNPEAEPDVKENEESTGTWILASAFPEENPDGSIEVIIGCFMDISQQKWAEGIQKRRMDEAIEAKRLQESFIDMTSHEMRNPLSAIVHCADGIITSLHREAIHPHEGPCVAKDDILSSLDAARTIIYCANHQKRIVDDILTLSKLDSGLLPVTPEVVQIEVVVKEALRMFESELRSSDIQLKLQIEPSLTYLNVDFVRIDPSRLTQVFINLLTNAIKFTQLESERAITVKLGASIERPVAKDFWVQFVKRKKENRKDLIEGAEWGEGELIYLHFAVTDTGRGLSEPEMDILFRRFSQATPKTHVQYGGSGLGLFISRELTELHGGEIGVSSRSGKGSTFAFYVKARRASSEDQNTRPSASVPAAVRPSAPSLTRDLSGTTLPLFSRPQSSPSVLTTSKLRQTKGFPILIVEDNLVNRQVLSKQLRNVGFIVDEANHGEEALACLAESRFWTGNEVKGKPLSLVLMDIEMPIMDGLSAMRRIRALQAAGKIRGHVPTIAVTANARKEQIETALDAGMDDVVSKPFRIPELVQRIVDLRERLGLTNEHDDLKADADLRRGSATG